MGQQQRLDVALEETNWTLIARSNPRKEKLIARYLGSTEHLVLWLFASPNWTLLSVASILKQLIRFGQENSICPFLVYLLHIVSCGIY